ncbi:MAG: hypothetical protein KGJ86_18960 [Chloroflexota bacterium]|nr:hypothetical protein [Chloroflexota bacterium]
MEHLDQLRTMLQRLSRINQSFQLRDAIDAEGALPTALPSRQALRTAAILLLADINRLDQEISAGSAYSLN